MQIWTNVRAACSSARIGSNFAALLEVLGGGSDDFNSAARWQEAILNAEAYLI